MLQHLSFLLLSITTLNATFHCENYLKKMTDIRENTSLIIKGKIFLVVSEREKFEPTFVDIALRHINEKNIRLFLKKSILCLAKTHNGYNLWAENVKKRKKRKHNKHRLDFLKNLDI